MSTPPANPYNPKVPQNPSDPLNITQPQLQNNFQKLFDAFVRNHVSLDAIADGGKHTIIELTEQDVPLQTDFNEINIYSREVEGQADQIYIRNQNNGQEFQFTNYQIYNLPTAANSENFFTFLPGKMLIYFGRFITLPNNVLNLVPPVVKNIITISLTPITAGSIKQYKPQVFVLPAENGFFNRISIRSAQTGLSSNPPPCWYVVMGNI